ncbi:MAG TPA: hypothetical protein VFT95_16495, partial [Micromonosporaceae bacterium]|nr:hypothetical protein [Micromonosporaceae bacterium]
MGADTRSAGTPARRFPRVLLGAAFFLAAAVLAAVGWLAFAVSERPADRFVGVILMAAALL